MVNYLEIESAKYLDDYKIELKFNDGKVNIVDFENFILNSGHPDIQKCICYTFININSLSISDD